jgi:hypothetical protein
MRSDPIDLGSEVADQYGRLALEWTVPADLEAGEHTVELSGPASGVYRAILRVEAAHQGGGTGGGSGGGADRGDPGSMGQTGRDAAGPQRLPFSGSLAGQAMALAALLMALGAAAMAAPRRRRDEPRFL